MSSYDKLPDRYKQCMTEQRWIDVCNLVKQKGMSVYYKDFTTSEIQLIINETPLSEKQKQGAELYYINRVKQDDIALRFGYSESTIKYYKKKISYALRETACRIFKGD